MHQLCMSTTLNLKHLEKKQNKTKNCYIVCNLHVWQQHPQTGSASPDDVQIPFVMPGSRFSMKWWKKENRMETPLL